MKKQILVIGLGRFGTSLARTLASIGHEVMAIDTSEQAVQRISNQITHAIQADATSETILEELGVRDFDIAVVAIGTSIENSVLSTILLKKLGVRRVIARANNELHKIILEKIGVDLVVSPEFEMGRRLAHGASLDGVSGYLDVDMNYGIAKVTDISEFAGKTLEEASIGPGGKLGVAALLIQRGKEVIVNPARGETVRQGDILILSGTDDRLAALLERKKPRQSDDTGKD